MSSPPLPPRDAGGFTLIEVLVALVILAVGLLALEAMSIGAAKMNARAERRSTYVAVATDTLERTLSRIRETGAAGAHTNYTEHGAQVIVSVGGPTTVGDPPISRFDVTVRVIPNAPFPQSDSVRLVASVVR